MFGNLGELTKLMSHAKEIQSNFQRLKEELPKLEFSASDASGRVRVRVSGDFRMLGVDIDSAVVDGGKSAVEQAMAQAAGAALESAKANLRMKFGELTGGLGLDAGNLF